MQMEKGSFTFPPQSHLTLYKRGASLGLTVPCSFPLCDAYHSGSVTSLCVGDKGRARSSCSLITKLIYQADVLLCRLCGVIQWARNGRCTRQGVFYEGLGTNSLTSVQRPYFWVVPCVFLCILNIYYYAAYILYLVTVLRKTNEDANVFWSTEMKSFYSLVC